MYAGLLILVLVHASRIAGKAPRFNKYSKGLALSDSSLAIYAGSNDVVAFTKLGQDKQEEAKEAFLNTVLTLSMVDVNGGLILPGMEEMVAYVQKSEKFAQFRQQLSDYSQAVAKKAKEKLLGKNWLAEEKVKLDKALSNGVNSVENSKDVNGKKILKSAARWFGKNGKFVLKALGPLTDVLSVGLSSWSLTMAVEKGDTNKILSSSLALVSGIIGLSSFVAVVLTGVTILGPIGIFIGALFGIAASLIELFGGSSTSDFHDQVAQLHDIKNVSMQQLFSAIEFFDKTKRPFNDVYVVNQAALLDFGERPYDDVELKEYSGYNAYSLVSRKSMSKLVTVAPNHPDIINGTFLLQGFNRHYGYGRPNWTKRPIDYGFDFYGKNPNGSEYMGTIVLLETNLISTLDTTRKGVYINTTVPPQYKQNDIIRLGDYENINITKKVTIDTGPGNDAINIEGLVGKLETAYENRLDVNLGSGINTVNFGGIRKEETRFKHVLFKMPSGHLFYIVSKEDRELHSVGFIHGVSFFSGSPLNDIIIMKPLGATSNHNSVRRDISETFRTHFVVTESYGSNNYIIDLSMILTVLTKFSILDHSANQSYITICDPMNRLTWKNLVYENRTLHIVRLYNGLSITTTLISISLRFSKKLPTIRLIHASPTSQSSLFPASDQYHPIHDVNPVLVIGLRESINFHQSGAIEGTDDSDLVELKCPENPTGQTSAQKIRLHGGTDYLLVNLEFIKSCVEDMSEKIRFHIHRSSSNTVWFVNIYWSKDRKRGLPEVTLHDVEKVVNEYGHELIDLKTEPEKSIDLYERYFEETKRQFGIREVEDENELEGSN